MLFRSGARGGAESGVAEIWAVVKGDDKAGVRPLDGPRPLESLRPRGARGARRHRMRRAPHSAARRRRGGRRGDKRRDTRRDVKRVLRNRRIRVSALQASRQYSSIVVTISLRTEPAETSELQPMFFSKRASLFSQKRRRGRRSRAEKRYVYQPRSARRRDALATGRVVGVGREIRTETSSS